MNPAIATTAFVLDNSVLCGWILANQATPYSDAIAGLLPLVDAQSPLVAAAGVHHGTGPVLAFVVEDETNGAPGPLPALGAGAAFGFSRKLRKRIKGSTNPVPNSYSL